MIEVKNFKPIEILLPVDGFHKGVLWAGLATDWEHRITARIHDGKFLSSQWKGILMYSSSN